jgi:hypothetical protein
MPQFAGSVMVLTQAVPQVVAPAGQPHTPAVQACPLGQALPHAPQLSGSLPIVFTHAPPGQAVKAHVAEHIPAEQNGVAAGQALPHMPQFIASDCSFTHPDGQAASGASHAHIAA